MSEKLTEYAGLFRLPSFPADDEDDTVLVNEECELSSQELLLHIYLTLNAPENSKMSRKHKMSLYSDETGSQSPSKCNCKKSKCLKLYCECFARGAFCFECNCECCQNTEEFSDERAKAIDQMVIREANSYGSRVLLAKGCNCKKTGCQKKYCECFNSNSPCNDFCKCSNCANC